MSDDLVESESIIIGPGNDQLKAVATKAKDYYKMYKRQKRKHLYECRMLKDTIKLREQELVDEKKLTAQLHENLADYVEMKKRQGEEAGEAMQLLDDLDYIHRLGKYASDEEEEECGYHHYQEILRRNYGPGKYQYMVTNGSRQHRLAYIGDVMVVLKEYFNVDPTQRLSDSFTTSLIKIPADHPLRTGSEETIALRDMFIKDKDSDFIRGSRIFQTSLHTFKQTRNEIKKQPH